MWMFGESRAQQKNSNSSNEQHGAKMLGHLLRLGNREDEQLQVDEQYISAVVISQVGDGLLSYLTQDAHADDIKNGEYLTMISEDLNQRMIPTTTVNLLQLENNEYPSEQHIQLATDFLDQHRNWTTYQLLLVIATIEPFLSQLEAIDAPPVAPKRTGLISVSWLE
uniref:Uncharacterized protein n=1 Tax=Ditylenchus dipsaci TaxID=166011 RepID=A0A915DA55_9BILA